ncbi:MAG TPA: hypothetical protein VLH61_02155 [Bacteroidales bacterium]|nr:hypothetical protein [Bacteroidales bacterium]
MKKLIVTALCAFSLLIGQPVAAQQDEILFRRYITSSGFHGLFYGIAFSIVADLEGPAAVGLPVLTAGTSVLIPLLTTPRITTNSLILSNHGRTMGWFHGFALSALILGEEIDVEDNEKIMIASGAISSIGLGVVGNILGRNRPWEEGQAALYAHYGMLFPFAGFSASLAFVDDLRLASGITLLSGAGGYFLANQIYRINPHTRGDVRAIRTLSLLNAGLAYGILIDQLEDDLLGEDEFERSDLIIPALGAVAGTTIGHFWLRNTRLTTRQGNISAFAATGGAVLGLGLALMTGADEIWPYYTFPYALGMGAFGLAVERFRSANMAAEIAPDRGNSNVSYSFMPLNLAFNQMLAENGPLTPKEMRYLQPFVSVSFRF